MMRNRLTTDKRKIFARESPTIMSMTKDELRMLYNEIFDRLQEYEVAEETGQIIVTPCKVGDIVFALWSVPTEVKYVVYYAEVVDIYISKRNYKQTIAFRLEPLGYRGRIREYFSDDFGKTVFFTKEEAKEALSKLQANYEQVKEGAE